MNIIDQPRSPQKLGRNCARSEGRGGEETGTSKRRQARLTARLLILSHDNCHQSDSRCLWNRSRLALQSPPSLNGDLTEGSYGSRYYFGAARLGAAHVTTASSQKKRKLAPFTASATDAFPNAPPPELFDPQGLQAHASRSSPSSSPLPPVFSDSNSQAPSPTSSHTTRNTTPPRFIPPHLHEEVLLSREFAVNGQASEGQSPSSAFAEITIDSGSSVDMSGSENGGNQGIEQQQQQRVITSPGRVLGARSASPAKRRAADMEDAGNAQDAAGQPRVPGSFLPVDEDERTDFDEAMGSMIVGKESMDTQETASNSEATSARGTMTTNTSATSFQSEDAPPPHSGQDIPAPKGPPGNSSSAMPSIDEQVREVYQIAIQPLDEGVRGYIVSSKWLARVMSRSTDGLSDSKYPKEAREGEIGPVDNSDIVPEDAFSGPPLHDVNKRPFIPLRLGLTMEEDYQVLPEKAWGLIISWYGYKSGQKQIERYAHNTAEPPAQNIIYEIYPPTLTIRKAPQTGNEAVRPTSADSALTELRLREEMRKRGQATADDALHLVSSRTERFQRFLERSKEAAGISRNTKVKMWRLLDPRKVTMDIEKRPSSGITSSPQSRSASPDKAALTSITTKLVVTPAEFKEMEIGKDIEHIDAPDETNNPKYNGKSTMDTFGLFEDQTILLEEQIGGPGGGEFPSDSKKKSRLLLKGPLKNGAKPQSAPTSGRTSPAPAGIITRGRARRDGRTRGTVGLTNLGNTCYMNSALQCIRSAEEMAMYFLSGKYKEDINASNPLGHGGAMAKQYANLLQLIYNDNAGGAITPTSFKKTLGGIQPLFSGYQQQDSQEFLSFLVDALHEDLNRVLKKPYNENPDSDDKTVHDPQAIMDLGEVYRKNHAARNDSIAMDLFCGFYKNTMECPVCEKISITFDPYSLLTVQLPIENTFQHTITFIPLSGKPINHAVDIDKNASIKMLKQSVAEKHSGVSPDRLWMAEVYSHKIYKVFAEDHQSLIEAGIQPNDYVFMFELPEKPTNLPEPQKKKLLFSNYSTYSNDRDIPKMDSAKADRMAVPVFSRQKSRYGSGWEIMLHPIYVMVSREEAQDFDTILKKVLVAVSRQTSRPILSEFDEDDGTAANGVASLPGEAEKDESQGEDAAQVSDRSVPSEDGYVEVSLGTTRKAPCDSDSMSVDKNAENEGKSDDRPVPTRFMHPQYFLSAALRNQLFALNYAKPSSDGGINCASMSSFDDKTVRNMFDRVKRPARRASVQSSSSDESTTSTGSNTQLTAETEESDIDDDEPDIKLGGEQPLSLPSASVADSDEEPDVLHDIPRDNNFSRGGRRARGKADKFPRSNRKQNVDSNNERKRLKRERQQQNRPNSRGSLQSNKSQRSFGGKLPLESDNTYYIQLGEAIILDWYPEGIDALFGGNPDNETEMRGHWLSAPDGKGLEFMPDPVLDEKKAKRLARKKHGITLEDCFIETGKREILSEDNAWYCNRCKEMRQAAKTLEIWTIPDILIVHLKRFGGNRSFRDKIDVNVEYPVDGLDMTEKVGLKENGREYVYDLFAVDNHYGGLGGGHYTAMAKNFYDGQWYDYNDGICSRVSGARLQSAAAYLLFYRRRSDKPLGPQYLRELVSTERNPEAESMAEEFEDSDSGEGKLGDPNGSLRGSSSALVGVGAGTSNANLPNPGSGGVGAGAAAGTNLTQRPTTRTNRSSEGDEPTGPLGYRDGKPIYGPQRPPQMMQYGNQGSQSWGFENLDQPWLEADEGTEMLLNNVELDDNASTAAEADSTFGEGDDDYRMEQEWTYTDAPEYSHAQQSSDWPSGGLNTPVESLADYKDDHSMYCDAYERRDTELDTLDMNEAGMEGGDPEPAEIHLEDDETGDDVKMD